MSLGNGRLWRRRQKTGATWVADWMGADNKRHRKALSSDRRVAQRMLADIIRRRDLALAGLEVEEGFQRPLAEVRDEFLADLRASRTPAYVDRVEAILRRVLEHMRVQSIRDLQPQAFLVYRRHRLAQGVANRTANHELTVVRTMLNWAVRSGYVGFNPLQGVQNLPTGRGYERTPRRALTDDEIDRFIRASMEIDQIGADRFAAVKTIEHGTKGPDYSARDRTPWVPQTPLWLLLVESGARFGEAVRTCWGDLSEPEAKITFRAHTTKSRKERTVPIRRSMVETLAELRVVHHAVRGRLPSAGDLIFLTPKGVPWVENKRNALRRLQEVLETAGIARVDERGEKIDIHSLRHTFASRLARHGVGLAQAQKLLGHSDPKLTAAIYTHLDTEDLRGAVEGLPAVGANG